MNQKLRISIATHLFDANGKKALKQGWRTFMKMEVKDTTFSSELKVGDPIMLDSVKQSTAKTKPPPLLSEKSLLDLMLNATKELDRLIKEETDPDRISDLKKQRKNLKNAEGIGTDRTRKGLILELIKLEPKTLKVTGKERILELTEFGWKYWSIVPKKLKSIEFSASWENAFEAIRQGKLTYEKFIELADKGLIEMVMKVINEVGTVVKPNPRKAKAERKKTSLVCPLCQNEIIDSGKVFKCSKNMYKNGKQSGCKFSIAKNAVKTLGISYDEESFAKLLDSTEDKPVSFSNANKVYLDIDNNYFTNIIWDQSKKKGK